jgi:hypothetical protein
MSKLFAVLTLACVGLACWAASAVASPAPTRLSIHANPDGVYGYVTSPAAKPCSADRKVLVYEQVGKGRDPQDDRRVGADLAAAGGARHRWTVKTDRPGPFYAMATGTKRCRAALSDTVAPDAPNLEESPLTAGYPPCSPYVSEGASDICDLGKLHMSLSGGGRFGEPSGQQSGTGRGAPFPWGANYLGYASPMRIYWHPEGSERSVVLVSFWGDSAEGNGAAHIGGLIANSSSSSFTVTDAFAQNEAGYPNGEHFYTPDLPGQAPGEVGGPLNFNFDNGSGGGTGDVYVSGFLYLRR